MAKVSLSIVVPVFSGEAYLEKLVQAVENFRLRSEELEAPFNVTELILVDDAARDGSPELIDTLAEKHAWIVALHLSRNFGQHAATVAGILHSSGDWVATIDEDLQHPPGQIFDLLERGVKENADVVYALPSSRAVHGAAWRDWSSVGFKRLMEWLTGTPTLGLVNSFRLLRGPIARAASSVCSHNTYFDIALTWFTERIAAVPMELRDLRFIEGKSSGYNLSRLGSHAKRMLFSSQLRFLSLGLLIGGLLFIASLFASVFVFFIWLFSPEMIDAQGWTSLVLLVCGSTGLLSLMLGLCLQYLSTLVLKAHGRPTFFTVDRSADQKIAEWFSVSTEKLTEKGAA